MEKHPDESSPFDFSHTDTTETQRIIELTRGGALRAPILREIVKISPTSYILNPIK